MWYGEEDTCMIGEKNHIWWHGDEEHVHGLFLLYMQLGIGTIMIQGMLQPRAPRYCT